jgi:3-phenylpropionate/trans-cinnamate dioxygenase ferredoxin subunit
MSATSFVPVARMADLDPGETLGVEARGIEIAVVRDEDGEVHAISDLCSHEEIALSDGDVEDCTIECWKHGSQFDLRTGRPLQLPAVRPVPVYPVQVDENGTIAVDPDHPLPSPGR